MVKDYKEAYYEAKEKIDNLNADIEEFKEEYKKLVDKFKDDELSNILVGANKEISAKINERKLTIQKDTDAMNKLVSDAEDIKKELIKLNAEKKALEILLNKSMDISKFYESTLSDIIAYSNENPDNLCGYFKQDKTKASQKHTNVKKNNKRISDKVTSEAFDLDSIISNDIVKN
jgi:chromosome segregation ATPase